MNDEVPANPKRRQDDVNIAVLAERVKGMDDRMTRIQEDQHEIIMRHDREFYGTEGNSGVKGDVGNLKQSNTWRSRREVGMFGMVMAVVGRLIYDLFHIGTPPS